VVPVIGWPTRAVAHARRAGIKLAWYLGAKQWDLVHLVMPSNIAWPVLPVVAWRRIPIYVSHHVDMEYYIYEYVKMKVLANFGYTFYQLLSARHIRHAAPRAKPFPLRSHRRRLRRRRRRRRRHGCSRHPSCVPRTCEGCSSKHV
jgi:hypothetical protein